MTYEIDPGEGIDDIKLGMPRALVRNKHRGRFVDGDYDSLVGDEGKLSVEFRDGRVARVYLADIEPSEVAISGFAIPDFGPATIAAFVAENFKVEVHMVEDGIEIPTVGIEFWSMDIQTKQYSSLHVVNPTM